MLLLQVGLLYEFIYFILLTHFYQLDTQSNFKCLRPSIRVVVTELAFPSSSVLSTFIQSSCHSHSIDCSVVDSCKDPFLTFFLRDAINELLYPRYFWRVSCFLSSTMVFLLLLQGQISGYTTDNSEVATRLADSVWNTDTANLFLQYTNVLGTKKN